MGTHYGVTIVLKSGHQITFRVGQEDGTKAKEIGLEFIKRMKVAVFAHPVDRKEWLEVKDGFVRPEDVAAIYLSDITETVRLEEALAR